MYNSGILLLRLDNLFNFVMDQSFNSRKCCPLCYGSATSRDMISDQVLESILGPLFSLLVMVDPCNSNMSPIQKRLATNRTTSCNAHPYYAAGISSDKSLPGDAEVNDFAHESRNLTVNPTISCDSVVDTTFLDINAKSSEAKIFSVNDVVEVLPRTWPGLRKSMNFPKLFMIFNCIRFILLMLLP